MAKAARLTSFLKSGTGLLTAAASLIAAVAALVTALTQFGGSSSSAETAGLKAMPTVATTVLLEDASERELRSHIPATIWPTCGRPTDAETEAVAAFNCTYRTVVGLQYNLFASSKEVETDYRSVKQRYGLAAPTGRSCDAGSFEGRYAGGGHVLCFVVRDDNLAAIVWTDKELDIVSFAWRNDGNLPALYEVWRRGVGPVA